MIVHCGVSTHAAGIYPSLRCVVWAMPNKGRGSYTPADPSCRGQPVFADCPIIKAHPFTESKHFFIRSIRVGKMRFLENNSGTLQVSPLVTCTHNAQAHNARLKGSNELFTVRSIGIMRAQAREDS